MAKFSEPKCFPYKFKKPPQKNYSKTWLFTGSIITNCLQRLQDEFIKIPFSTRFYKFI